MVVCEIGWQYWFSTMIRKYMVVLAKNGILSESDSLKLELKGKNSQYNLPRTILKCRKEYCFRLYLLWFRIVTLSLGLMVILGWVIVASVLTLTYLEASCPHRSSLSQLSEQSVSLPCLLSSLLSPWPWCSWQIAARW